MSRTADYAICDIRLRVMSNTTTQGNQSTSRAAIIFGRTLCGYGGTTCRGMPSSPFSASL
eukprot:4905136-Amphidinium_carterae.1